MGCPADRRIDTPGESATVSEENWEYKGYTVAEGPAAGQPVEPYIYVFRIRKTGAHVCTYTIVSDAGSVKVYLPDIDPTRVGDVEAMWGALSGEGYVRICALID